MSDSSNASRRGESAVASLGVPVFSASEHEAAPRPKVLRRPAQFQRASSTATPPTPPASRQMVAVPTEENRPVATAPHAPTYGRAWQDDVRFGFALIVSLFLFNLAFILLVPHIPVRTNGDDATGTAMFGNGSMPQAVGRESSDVTLYAQPESEKAPDVFDIKNLNPKQNGFSVSPRDIPPPNASPLNSGQDE